MSSILETAKRNAAEKAARPKQPANPARLEVDVSDLSPYQAAKKINAASKAALNDTTEK